MIRSRKRYFYRSNHRELTLARGAEAFTVADWAYLRISADRVDVWGNLRAMRMLVKDRPKVLINGREDDALIADGYLSYHKPSD